jgi:endonuclease/exonuclease/phosphatase family metal-dependent hydrolase
LKFNTKFTLKKCKILNNYRILYHISVLSKNLAGIMVMVAFCNLTCRETIGFVPENELSVAFYNLDNLFDVIDDSTHHDVEFTPHGKYAWTPERYEKKLHNMEQVIREMVDGDAPDVLGVCELESKYAFKDLLATGWLHTHYGFVHYDSPDERGIDVAMAYNLAKLKILESKNYPVMLSDNIHDKTRDILWVKALTLKSNDTIQFIVCHFPSRREGKEKSNGDRMDAARTCERVIRENCRTSSQNLVIMGDFNDEPWDESIVKGIGAADINGNPNRQLLNLMWHFKDEKKGSYKYRKQWNMLDQIIISKALSNGQGMEYTPASVRIMSKSWMIQTGKYNGFPLRTFGGSHWLDGYSDHLPVYMKIKLKE